MSQTEINTVTFADRTYTLDEQGFLDPSDQWDENFADGMAEQEGIYEGLTDRHWEIVNYVRRKFIDENTVSVVVLACADNDLRLSELRYLFPSGYHRGACRIAGINYAFMYSTNYWLTYETSTMPKEEFKVTAHGFLEDFDRWNERFAQLIIREWKLPSGLTDRHRQIIDFLRQYYTDYKNIPPLAEVCRGNDLTLDELRDLFPAGYRRGACRMSGLPFFA